MRKNYLSVLMRTFAGRVDHVAYAVLGATAIGLLLRYASGTPITAHGLAVGLIGNAIVIALARWLKRRYPE